MARPQCNRSIPVPARNIRSTTSTAEDSRLRFVFADAVVSFRRAGEVTLGDIARTLGDLAGRRLGNPVAIDVTLGCRKGG